MGELDRFVCEYAMAFDTCDAERIVDFYHVPTAGISAASVDVYSTREALLAQFTSVTQAFRAAQLTRCRPELQASTTHGPDLAELRVRWSLYGPGGVVSKTLLNVYILRRCEGRLKIAAVVLLDPASGQEHAGSG